ncbi:MAG: mechanosensitive ion channel family protein [Pseudomonadota bacterium]
MQAQDSANQPSQKTGDSNTEINVVQPLLEQIEAYAEGFIRLLPNIGLAIIVLLSTWLAATIANRIITGVLRTARIRRALADLLTTLVGIGVWVFGILIAATVLFPSLEPASILAALGVGGIAVGFAFKDIFENFMAGAMIMLRKPMRIGDFIECEGVEGKVEEITIRDTYIRQTDDQLVMVPNSLLFKNPVYIRTDNDLRRFEIIAGVGYGEDIDKCRDIICNAVKGLEGLSGDKPVQVFAREFGASSINYTVRWWTKSEPIEMHRTRDRVIAAIKRALDDADVEIPFPYRTLTFSEPLKIENAG